MAKTASQLICPWYGSIIIIVIRHLLRLAVDLPAAMSLLAVLGLLALQAEKRGVSSRRFLASTVAPAPSRRSVSSGIRTREAARWRGLREKRDIKNDPIKMIFWGVGSAGPWACRTKISPP